jgi:formate dehydrogenase major subunit
MTDVALTIDGRPTAVSAGTTVLDAARGLGIEIPTLCHVEGLEPVASCFLCVVQVEGRRNLSPSCALPVEEGMVVETDTADLRATRKMALELLLSDHAGECSAPCARGCPAELDIPGFTLPLANGRPEEAMQVVARTLALPGALGRVCPRLCEESCRRCGFDEGLAIGALHRHVAELDLEAGGRLPPKLPPSHHGVAVVGAGPAGLAAAYYLLQAGHRVTLFDAHEHAGGMLRYGIPEYRLPREALAAEIALVERLGAEFRMGVRWGEDFGLAELREGHAAVFLAIGAQRAAPLGCPGEELATSGIAYLAAVARGEAPGLGARIVVVGGGNTAVDVARSALRQALRARAADAELPEPEVHIVYRRTREDMPCLLEEVLDAEAEGVTLECLVAPTRLERSDDGTLAVTCTRMRPGEPDASGRRRPVPVEGSEHVLEATAVVAATGQRVELELAEREGLAVTGWGIASDPRTFRTNLEGVFAGGDAVLGPDLAVRAVAAGRRAAVAIDQHVRGREVVGAGGRTEVAFHPLDEDELARVFRDVERSPRTASLRVPVAERRASFDEVDGGLALADVESEARRCMSCGCRKADSCTVRHQATIHGADPERFGGPRRRFEQDHSHPELVYEPGKCIVCDACVRAAADEGEELGVALVGRGFDVAMGVPFDEPLGDGLRRAARRAAEVCPTAALALRTERACDACALAGLVQGQGRRETQTP